MIIIWTDLAKFSYIEELEYIYHKWNTNETEKFAILVNDFIESLKSGVLLGKTSDLTKIRSFVISKQTTLYFEFHKNKIELLLFWNNQKDPKELKLLLSKK